MKKWIVEFEENGSEYIGTLIITANNVNRDNQGFEHYESERVLIADGVHVEIDEKIISIKEAKEENKSCRK